MQREFPLHAGVTLILRAQGSQRLHTQEAKRIQKCKGGQAPLSLRYRTDFSTKEFLRSQIPPHYWNTVALQQPQPIALRLPRFW